MMMSHEHKAIFLHAPKTGGSTIRHVLWEQFGFVRPPGLTDWHTPFIPTSRDDGILGYGGYDGWFLFGSVRNPYARLVSLFGHLVEEMDSPTWQIWWRLAGGVTEDFSEFARGLLRNGPPAEFPPQCCVLRACSVVLRQEHLEEDFNGLPFVHSPVTLPRLNAREHAPWPSYYTAETANLVTRWYGGDFIRYGYSFDVAAG